MQVKVNGDLVETDEGVTVEALIESLGLSGRWVVAELNGEAVDRSRMSKTELAAGDELIVVRPVAGG